MPSKKKTQNAAKAEVTKVESAVQYEVAKVETSTYSGKVLLVVAAVAFVLGVIVRSIL